MIDNREILDFEFTKLPAPLTGEPERIAVHRNDNLGAGMLNTLEWGERTGAFTIHRAIQHEQVWRPLPLNRHAYHIREYRVAERKGYQVRHSGVSSRKRGDIRVLGIECADEEGGGPGQEYSLSQRTRISLVLELADIMVATPSVATVEQIGEHAHYDPWSRAKDLGDALYIPDLRLDVTDVIQGHEPWRTVQRYAYGRPAPEDWRGHEPLAGPSRAEAIEEIKRRLFAASDTLRDIAVEIMELEE